jgi:taurine dioxygenase
VSGGAGAIAFHPVTATLGAEVTGIDLRQPVDGDQAAAIRAGLVEHQVLFFRDQDVTPAQQLAFSEALGPTMLPMIDTESTEAPGVTVLDQTAPKGQYTDRWHTDHLFVEEPPMASMLRAVQLPAVGGDTCFSSMFAAYEALSPALRAFLDGLTAVHSTGPIQGAFDLPRVVNRRDEDLLFVRHPLVRVHPESGRRALFVSENFTVGVDELDAKESRALLDLLFAQINTVRFQCRFRWEVDSIALWDNRAVQHCALYDYQERRLMYRTMVDGDRPYGPVEEAAVAAAGVRT